jgi:hypothetical protein
MTEIPPFLAWYWHYGTLQAAGCDTAEEAVRYLARLEDDGDGSSVGVEDTATGEAADTKAAERLVREEEEAEWQRIQAAPRPRYVLRLTETLSDEDQHSSGNVAWADDPAEFGPWLDRFGDRCQVKPVRR